MRINGVTYEIGDYASYSDLAWSSDWNGEEVGYDEVEVVGLYSFLGTDVFVYLDTEDGTILDIWEEVEEW